MRIILLSDIHGNLTALDAVLEDAHRQGAVDLYLVLGDLVAIGPDPIGEHEPHWFKRGSCVLLVDKQGQVALQLRDNKPGVGWADCWGLFGGLAHAGETPEETLTREMEDAVLHEGQRYAFVGRQDIQDGLLQGKKIVTYHRALIEEYWRGMDQKEA